MASQNVTKLAAFTVLLLQKLVVKLNWWLQYAITAKSPFKTSIDSLQDMLSNFKKHTTRILSASLTALQPTVRPTSSRCIGPIFCR